MIEDTLGYSLVTLCKAHRRRLGAALSELGIHVGQELILLRLWQQDGQTQSQLVKRVDVEPPTLTRALQRMEQAGLLERRADPNDARVTRVFLSAKGSALQGPVEAAWRKADDLAAAGLDQEELEDLKRLLHRVHRNIEAD